ncbi:type IV pilus modification protein PilV [Parashewanella curva]|uniref:Type IV pilus modification protein PilV n=1 Tax=Parashewanella curva TaxID=2338552 RepID=A0A3L8Q178_9GAMM|nr:type IV pilus modification protein PilV [Parashewanella curva]RLV61427.1 type IV pilus modification protein PilV [Parashewanella curva]
MQRYEKGLSLIEVLVSLVILVIGLIGVFNLHLISKQGSFESFQQTQAAYLAHDILNRIKINASELPRYPGTYTGNLPKPDNLCQDRAAVCTPSQMRRANLYLWEQALMGKSELEGTTAVGGLDSPTACIVVNNSRVEVMISWRGIRKTSDGATDHYSGKTCGTASSQRRLYVVKSIIRES